MALASYSPGPVSLSLPTLPVYVFRNDGTGNLSLMPNVRFLGCKFEEGSTVPNATFRYVFDRGGAIDTGRRWPATPEAVLGANAYGPYVVQPDDHLTVYIITSAGDRRCVWDGFAMIPAGTIDGSGDGRMGVAFVGLGTPIRCYDTPMIKRVQRDGDDPWDPAGDVEIDLPAHFNPKGKGNCTPKGADGQTGDFSHPVFIDHLLVEDRPVSGRHWEVAGAAKYVLARGNSDQQYVQNPNLANLDKLLDARDPNPPNPDTDPDDQGEFFAGGEGDEGDEGEPPPDPAALEGTIIGQANDNLGGEGEFDNNQGDSFTSRPVKLKDLDVTGLAWPDALEKILRPYGFRFRFELSQQSDLPSWRVRIYRVADDDPMTYKQFYLQAGGALDPGQTNVAEMHLVRDPVDVANEYTVESARVAYEISAVLAPGFKINEADAAPMNLGDYVLNGPNFKGYEDDYRLYIFDECGEGHWDFTTNSWKKKSPPSLATIMGGVDHSENLYVRRRRPGRNVLFSKSALFTRKHAELLISADYKGPSPGLWDGTGTWYAVSKTWLMCDDRLGIRLACASPESWNVGPAAKGLAFGVNIHSAGGKVNGVSAQALKTETHFYLMLVTVIEGDLAVKGKAKKRNASPSRYTIGRLIEARDRYRFNVITKNSWHNKTNMALIDRDDIQAATDDALTRRAANEMPRLSGPVVVRRLVNGYEIGDRITDVVGRDISLQSNVGDGGGEGSSYPRIVAYEYRCDPEQQTIYHLEDDRPGHQPAHRDAWRRT